MPNRIRNILMIGFFVIVIILIVIVNVKEARDTSKREFKTLIDGSTVCIGYDFYTYEHQLKMEDPNNPDIHLLVMDPNRKDEKLKFTIINREAVPDGHFLQRYANWEEAEIIYNKAVAWRNLIHNREFRTLIDGSTVYVGCEFSDYEHQLRIEDPNDPEIQLLAIDPNHDGELKFTKITIIKGEKIPEDHFLKRYVNQEEAASIYNKAVARRDLIFKKEFKTLIDGSTVCVGSEFSIYEHHLRVEDANAPETCLLAMDPERDNELRFTIIDREKVPEGHFLEQYINREDAEAIYKKAVAQRDLAQSNSQK